MYYLFYSCYNECREGQCSGSPRFECECSLGWTSDPATLVLSGVECDVDCGCNFHSTCITAPGICDECQSEIIRNQFFILVIFWFLFSVKFEKKNKNS